MSDDPASYHNTLLALIDDRIQVALNKPTGITPGVYSGITLDRYGRARFAGASSVLQAVAQQAAGTAWFSNGETRVNFGSVLYDPGSAITTGTAWRYLVPAAGWYEVQVQYFFDTGTYNDGDTLDLVLYINNQGGGSIITIDHKGEFAGGTVSASPFLFGGVVLYVPFPGTVDVRMQVARAGGSVRSNNAQDDRITIFKY